MVPWEVGGEMDKKKMDKKKLEYEAILQSMVKWRQILDGKVSLLRIRGLCPMCVYYREPITFIFKSCRQCALARVGHGCLEPGSTYLELDDMAAQLGVKRRAGDRHEMVLHMESMRDERYPTEREYMRLRMERMLAHLQEALDLVWSEMIK